MTSFDAAVLGDDGTDDESSPKEVLSRKVRQLLLGEGVLDDEVVVVVRISSADS